MDRQCLRRLLRPYYYVAIILALIGVIIAIPISIISLFMLVLSWLFYVLFLVNLMDKIDFERDTCLMDGNNFGIFASLVMLYLVLSLCGSLNILFYQVLKNIGVNMLFTLYSMLFVATLTSTSILFTLGNWVISRRDGKDGRFIAVVRFTRRALLFIFVVVFLSLLSVADFLVMQRILFATFFLAISLGLTITMAQTLVIMHALMDALSELTKPEGETKGPEHKVEGVKEGTGGASKSQS